MSKYTVQLRRLIENNFDLGLTSYPLFDENYRTTLNNNITRTYFYKEIAYETPAMFRQKLITKMNIIMPYYNQLYNSTLLTIDPFNTANYNITDNTNNKRTTDTTTTANQTGKTTTSDTSQTNTSGNTDGLNVESDTPQGMLSIGDIKTNTYASKAVMNNGTSNATTTGTATGESDTTADQTAESKGSIIDVDTYLRHVIGNDSHKSMSELLTEYRGTFLNIDKQIIDELNSLFMIIW